MFNQPELFFVFLYIFFFNFIYFVKTRGKQDMCFRCVSSLFKANVAEAGAGRLKLGAPYLPLQPLMLVILFVFENSM